jgi:hypothetical protein
MRLVPEQIEIIKSSVRSLAGSSAKVLLFGSRVDEEARGGDIDLFVEIDQIAENRAALACQIAAAIQIGFTKIGWGDPKVDVILVDPETPHQIIHDYALKSGVLL